MTLRHLITYSMSCTFACNYTKVQAMPQVIKYAVQAQRLNGTRSFLIKTTRFS